MYSNEFMEGIKRFCVDGWLEEAFASISQQRVPLSKDIIFNLLRSALKKKDIQAGRRVRNLMATGGFFTAPILGDYLIRLFALCGSLSEANDVFGMVVKPTVYTWNSIISAHVKLGEDEKALDLSVEMQKQGGGPDGVTFSCMLKACGNMRELINGRLIHDQMTRAGLGSNLIIASTLVDLYAKCGSLYEACRVFNGMEKRDIVTWGSIIAAYTQQGDGLTALDLFKKMQSEKIEPNMVVLSSVVKACGSMQDLEQGRLVHQQIRRSGLSSDVVMGSSLVDMYVKCGSLKEAQQVFDELRIRDIITWGTLILGYATHGHLSLAFEFLKAMQCEGMLPNCIILECILKACRGIEHLGYGRLLHEQVVIHGLDLNLTMRYTLVQMYANVGALDEARRVFEGMPCRNVQSWNCLIAASVQHGYDDWAFKLFDEMREAVILPNKSTILHMVKACEGALGGLDQCMLIHHHAISSGLEADGIIGSSLLDLYGKRSSIESARKIFDGLLNSDDVVSWGAMIQGYVSQGDGYNALKLFDKMLSRGLRSTKVIFSSVLKGCATQGAVQQGRWIHDQVVREELHDDAIVGSSTVDMYAKCAYFPDAECLFLKLPSRDATSWGAIIAASVAHGDVVAVFEYVQQMQQEGFQPDKVVFSCMLKACGSVGELEQGRFICDQVVRLGLVVDVVLENSLIDMYAKCSSLEDARKVFDGVQEKDVVSWGAMIEGYAAHGDSAPALELLEKMQEEGLRPNKAVLLSALKACGVAGSARWVRLIHDQIVRHELESERTIGNALVDVYGKCESFGESQKVFDTLPSRDVVSWASMVSGISRDGDSTRAQSCLEEMQRRHLKPVGNTFINMLSVCTHAGLLEEGVTLFGDIKGDGSVALALEPYSCMIDLLGRAGCQREAEDFIQTMPISPDLISFTSLLTNCKMFGKVKLVGDWFEKHDDRETMIEGTPHSSQLFPTNPMFSCAVS